jgi:hypothetical protein
MKKLIKLAIICVIMLMLIFVGILSGWFSMTLCKLKGGVPFQSLYGGPFCAMPADDGGKFCTNSSQCKGGCLANLSGAQLDRLQHEGKIEANGTCNKFLSRSRGCKSDVHDGFAEPVLCYD